MTIRTILPRLAALLDRETTALKDASISALTALSPEKEKLLEEFAQAERELDRAEDFEALEAEMGAIKAQAAENARRLRNVADGVRLARQRLAALNAAAQSFGAYAPDGERVKTSGSSTLVSDV